MVRKSTSLPESLERLKSLKISHKHYDITVNEIYGATLAALPGEAICITGPSRVGKSKATLDACSKLIPNIIEERSNFMPLVKMTARNSANKAKFDTKAFIAKALVAIKHPLYGMPEPDDELGITFDRRILRTSEEVLMAAFVRALDSRKTKYLVIDEAQHLKYIAGGISNAGAVFDSWKCLAEELGIVLIIIGAYPILPILNLSPHMLGRSLPVHFPRYRETLDELNYFQEVLNTLDSIVPLKKGRLSDHNKLLHQGSQGCMGLLLRWLRASIGHAISKNKTILEISDIKLKQMQSESFKSIKQEINDGEEQWKQLDVEKNINKQKNNNTFKPKIGKTKKQRPFQSKPRNYKQNDRY